MISGILDDLVVLDLSEGIAGPLCGRLLADYGARVIKIEPREGARDRRLPPFMADDPHPEKSLFHLLLNLNKRSITLDITRPEGADLLRRLVRKVDVIVESFSPGYLASLDLDYSTLERENPSLVMTSITPFGQTGPYSQYKGCEIVAYATSGMMAISGESDREPLQHGGFPALYEAGMNGFLATNVALLTRDLNGLGQHVDVSIQEVVTSSLIVNQSYYSFAGGVQGRRHAEGTNFGQIMPCKDGYFIAQAGGGASWDNVADFFGRPELKEHRFADPEERVHNGAEMDAIILEATRDRTMAEMFKSAAEKYRMLLGIVQTPEDLANCPQLEARAFYEEVEHPVIGKMRVPFRLWNMSEGGASYRTPAPLLGQHTAEVLGEAGCAAQEIVDLRARGVV
ncbi:CoA transferase [Bradyrhizobium sp. 183]|uniref:CaiB/BaiF CoA transferase family protein n=1 Tax=unclassified Bradyrhizobium TaxID=2631580 RepID=UPI001FFF7DFB|nr:MULTISPECIES: CoA transferase [unclassified Bradyrhizobium]UPJ79327.1 CoA transferase [Bradyrhizobium sp. 184]UPJ87121.1 CoA transferase [Bradyrhizobium sp. 183]